MKKGSSSKTAKVIAFLKANSEDISIEEMFEVEDRNLRRKRKIAKGSVRKASQVILPLQNIYFVGSDRF